MMLIHCLPLHIVTSLRQRSSDAPAAAQSASPPQPAPPQETLQCTPSSEPPSESGFLPAGWEVRSAPSGRPFYIDHNTKTTTWVRGQQMSVLYSPCGDRLHWQMAYTKKTNIFWHDKKESECTQVCPSGNLNVWKTFCKSQYYLLCKHSSLSESHPVCFPLNRRIPDQRFLLSWGEKPHSTQMTSALCR